MPEVFGTVAGRSGRTTEEQVPGTELSQSMNRQLPHQEFAVL